ncbi:pyridoxamine 5'-phosphate oxidase family protein [Pseudonocardia sp. CA-107938]|uniref:pyridoxamine 5'-phosphate oxidase family protein n=1 Tax=Pseudonocardia sp. CA-107938 TaxID=3240021 RepID=UPI003D8DFBB6
MSATMSTDEIADILTSPYARQLLESKIPARIAYTGLDGFPRVVPVGYDWDGTHIRFASIMGSAKNAALQSNPQVAITIDTESYPPKVLLIRGTAQVEIVDGVPDVYVRASTRRLPEEERQPWEEGVRALFDRMAVVTITPTWVRLLDFESTFPRAFEDVVAARGGSTA